MYMIKGVECIKVFVTFMKIFNMPFILAYQKPFILYYNTIVFTLLSMPPYLCYLFIV